MPLEYTTGVYASLFPENSMSPSESTVSTAYEKSWNNDIAQESLRSSQICVSSVSPTERNVQMSSKPCACENQSRPALDHSYESSTQLPASGPPADFSKPIQPLTGKASTPEDSFLGATGRFLLPFTGHGNSIMEKNDVEVREGLDACHPNLRSSFDMSMSPSHTTLADLEEIRLDTILKSNQIAPEYYPPGKARTCPFEPAIELERETEDSFVVSEVNHHEVPLSTMTDHDVKYSSHFASGSCVTAVEDTPSGEFIHNQKLESPIQVSLRFIYTS